MMPSYIALTTLTNKIRTDELSRVAAALQTQILRDFAPIWGASAVIAAASFEAIPSGFIPVIVQDRLAGSDVNGFHRTRSDDTPYIVVAYGKSWPLAVSHEVLRMLANPTGSARLPGPSPLSGQGTVEYMLHVTSPCQDGSHAYAIDGLAMSDFCTPRFFGGSGESACSFTRSVPEPFTPAPGGMMTWLADDSLLYQARAGISGRTRIYGGFSCANRGRLSLSELVDRLTPDRLMQLSQAIQSRKLVDAEQNARRSHFANMTRFQDDITWRFGREETLEDPQAPTYADQEARSGQQRARTEVETTLRTAS